MILAWLQETYGCEVVTFTADLGQGEELEPVRGKAAAAGVKEIFIDDLREEFVRDFVFPMFRANALYEGTYLLGTSIARPLIARRQIEIAREVGADAVSHGATGKGNDQVTFRVLFCFFCSPATFFRPALRSRPPLASLSPLSKAPPPPASSRSSLPLRKKRKKKQIKGSVRAGLLRPAARHQGHLSLEGVGPQLEVEADLLRRGEGDRGAGVEEVRREKREREREREREGKRERERES